MKFAIPEISWHNRDPVLSVDFQPKSIPNEPLRLASGGSDFHVLIWYISTSETGSVNLEVAADLNRHQKAVNVVRWSPNGQYLASGDDEAIIFIWKQKTDKDPTPANQLNVDQGEEQYKEAWIVHKTLRGHMEDVLDLTWSANSEHLASGSVDNKLLVWDVTRGKYSSILTDHKGFVQGVAWDPLGQFIVTTSTDRVFRTFDVNTKKVVSRSSKTILPFPPDHPFHDIKVRLFHDDTLQTYYRRLHFSPDGLLIAVPGGRIEPEQGKLDTKPINAVYIYTRYSLKTPACVVACGEAALAARWSPRRYAPRARGPRPALPTPHRMVLAVGTKRSVLLYDTQQKTPIAFISNIHYTRLTDLTWSPDGLTLIASSTDGFCSIISFNEGELGEILPEEVKTEANRPEPMVIETDLQTKAVKEKTTAENKTGPTKSKLDSFIKFKAPTEKSPSRKQTIETKEKTPVKLDVLVETAMPSWSDNSSNEIITPPKDCIPTEVETKSKEPEETMEIDDTEDIKLVYEETTSTNKASESDSPKESNTDASKSSPESKQSHVEVKPESSKPTCEDDMLKQAKVPETKEPMPTKPIQAPKAPRRVSFITLSSPKNPKKKC